jgi:hypothetical protein
MPIDANRGKGECPRIIFTLDFHELVYGDLTGGDCVVLYDPHRVVPESEIEGLPATQRPIVMHVRFHPSGQAWEGEMRFKKADRLIVDKDASGEGTMLRLEYPIPAGDDEIECWFSYVGNSGTPHWDSHMGANFWMRFPNHDLTIARADIMARENEAMDLFQLEVDSVAAVESMTVRWRYTNAINDARYQLPLAPVIMGDRKQWTLGESGAPVAWDTPLAFDLVYTSGGHKFTDDNQGTWYVVSRS